MTDTSLNTKKIGGFDLQANTVEEASDAIIERLARFYCLLQPEKSATDFLEEVVKPIFDSTPEKPAAITFTAYTKHSEQTNLGFMTMIATCCAHCIEAQKADEAAMQMKAWQQLSNAMYQLGKLEGLLMVEPAIAHIITSRGAKGAKNRNAKFDPIREFARELASHQTHETKRKAALLIKKAVLAFADKSEVEMSEYEAERTIIKWLDGMTFATK
jgi:hypothetical protein